MVLVRSVIFVFPKIQLSQISAGLLLDGYPILRTRIKKIIHSSKAPLFPENRNLSLDLEPSPARTVASTHRSPS
jgi:hypothetical protein